jgi:hypothetical protein
MPVNVHTSSGTPWNRSRAPAADIGVANGWTNLASATVLRFVADDNSPQSIIEAAVDDVRIVGDCGSANCPSDVDHNGAVDVDDLVAVILGWGACTAPPCPADIAPPGGSGAVDVDDLVAVILAWGACPG